MMGLDFSTALHIPGSYVDLDYRYKICAWMCMEPGYHHFTCTLQLL